MGVRLSGFTRASSLGPIADFMDRQGGCVTRVLRDVELPVALLDNPEIVIPLRVQFRFLERAAQQTGDACFGARLGQVVHISDLGQFGAWVCASETLQQAIERAHKGLNAMLQTSTVLTLKAYGPSMRWSIAFLEPETDGRRHNELLALSYMIDAVQTFAGRSWRPKVIMTTLPSDAPRRRLEEIFGTHVSMGHEVNSFHFDASLLTRRRVASVVRRATVDGRSEPSVPGQNDMLATFAAVTDLALYEGYPRIDWVADKLGMSGRTLQRRLDAQGLSFQRLVEERLLRRAKMMLETTAPSITEIAFELGYRDLAHFTRAFRRWTGISPSAYRRDALNPPVSAA